MLHRSLPVASLLLALGSLALAHEDDPKILHVRPAVAGPGYRAAAWGRGAPKALAASEAFPASNATLLSWIPLAELGATRGNDCWGYTSASGRRYALFGSHEGTHVVEVTNPSDPAIVGFVDGPNSLWRDVKVYGTRAYAVSEGGSGIQVIDLSGVDAGVVTLTTTVTSGGGGSATHNVAIDTDSGFLYRCGGGSNGLRMYSLANPASPSFAGSWSDRYVHDVQVKTYASGPYAGRQIAFCCSGFNGGGTATGLSIVDVTSKSNPVHRGQVHWPSAGYSHQAWLSEDGLTLFLNDELDENGSFPTTTYVIDVSDIDAPALLGSFTNGNTAIGHNLYVRGNLAYEANYTSGLRVFDVSGKVDAPEVAYFDTAPEGDATTFNGMWSNYPFFGSAPAGPDHPGGLVIGSDMERGLFVIWVGPPLVDLQVAGGLPAAVDPDGHVLDVTLVEQVAGEYVPGSAKLFYDAGDGLVEQALADHGGGALSAELPALPCGSEVRFYLTAQSASGWTWVDPPNGAFHVATVAPDLPVALADDLETGAGWTAGAPGDTATEGAWELGEPIGTPAQPDHDHTGAGQGFCFFTGQGPASGGLPFAGDVDDGKTTLLSPVLDLSGLVDPRVSYWRWYSNHKGINPGMDKLVIDMSADGGATWIPVDAVGPGGPEAAGKWIHHEVRVLDVAPGAQHVQLRFVASDLGAPSTVEAAIDDLEVRSIACPDCDGDAQSDALALAAGLLLDLDQEGTPDVCQPLSADAGAISAAAGGAVHFALAGGPERAGEAYLLLGSLSGTTPGFDLGAVHVPLAQDFYLSFSLAHANQPPLHDTFGVLDGAGEAAASLQLGPAAVPAGLAAHHAWIALDLGTATATLASNALPLAITP